MLPLLATGSKGVLALFSSYRKRRRKCSLLQLQEAKEYLLPPLATGVTRVNAPSCSYRHRNLMTICVLRRADNSGNSAGYSRAQPGIYWPYTIMSQNPKAQKYCKKLTEKKKEKREKKKKKKRRKKSICIAPGTPAKCMLPVLLSFLRIVPCVRSSGHGHDEAEVKAASPVSASTSSPAHTASRRKTIFKQGKYTRCS